MLRMITPQKITSKYRAVEPYLEPLRDRVRQTIHAFSDKRGFAVFSRVKALESLSEKIETGRFRSWSDLDDIVATTIVVPTLSHEADVVTFLQTVFDEVEIKRRNSTKKAPDVFRFDSTRFIGRLHSGQKDALPSEIEKIKFEVQIKSAFEHAWAVTTHALTYKAAAVKWNRLRLAAQMKAAVEQLDLLVLAFEEASLRIDESVWPEIEAKESIAAFFRSAVAAKELPEELTPKDWNRFCDSVYCLVEDSAGIERRQPSQIADEIKKAVRAELLELGPERIPMSISLWQFTFGTLCKRKVLLPPLRRLRPVITPELEMFYPAVSQFSNRFDFFS